jgi:hypothetical protein
VCVCVCNIPGGHAREEAAAAAAPTCTYNRALLEA